ncbi:hypothetical protein E3N88_07060 [Mikania micrantha]|uniref:Uncharacterized protein n=1 Tax=Mikania micrantha TaxID=192012 RepID=A0A5N6PQF5_9ASTR|nr:hypothetical protein E3N88_07060 [Mikania micrantha]
MEGFLVAGNLEKREVFNQFDVIKMNWVHQVINIRIWHKSTKKRASGRARTDLETKKAKNWILVPVALRDTHLKPCRATWTGGNDENAPDLIIAG